MEAFQTGHIEGFNFKFFGVEDYTVDEHGNFKEYLHTLRGINLYKEDFETGDDGFHISYTFLQPFEKDIEALQNRHW